MLKDFTAFAGAWWRARRFGRLRNREQLLALQGRWLEKHLDFVARHSPYYRDFAGRPFEQWPLMQKSDWMRQFDLINTAGARREELETLALRAENTRDFSPTWRGHTVGFSTGTSGHRGMFFVSPVERARWAGTLIGRMLHLDPLRGEKLALLLRAGSPLYERASTLRIQFRYFDQARPWTDIVADLREYQPTVLIAPARVLSLLADEASHLHPRRLISVAEVLDELDRVRIEAAFGVRVEQIYQATEGLLGTTCEYGTVHLMEPWIHVEPRWLDAERTRFTPLITDLWRHTQPVIRYQLNDVLRLRPTPCPCGRAALALDGIDGRLDDLLWLAGSPAPVCVFPDLITREIVLATDSLHDYEVVEVARGHWQVALDPLPDPPTRRRVVERLQQLAARLGATAPTIETIARARAAPQPLAGKQRRVRRAGRLACAS
jgi:putative adenylate-forming enzyme